MTPMEYEVGREKIREYARAIGETHPIHYDREAALAAGYRDVVAPPMFVAVYSEPVMERLMAETGLSDPGVTALHAEQTFEWFEPVCAGDVISVVARASGQRRRGRLLFWSFDLDAGNQAGERVSWGRWVIVERDVNEARLEPISGGRQRDEQGPRK